MPEARTAEWYQEDVASFLTHRGDQADRPLASREPYHVFKWVDSHETWGDTFKRGGIVAVQRACSWAEQMGYMDATPLKRVAKPTARRRDNSVAPEDFQAMLETVGKDNPFRDLFLFLWHTGCRPQESRHIEKRPVDLERAVVLVPQEEAKGKRYPRFVHLHGPALEIARRLMAVRGEGKLFRNARGESWKKYALCNRMYRLSRVAGVQKTAYDMRLSFATRKLVQGHDHLTIAELRTDTPRWRPG